MLSFLVVIGGWGSVLSAGHRGLMLVMVSLNNNHG